MEIVYRDLNILTEEVLKSAFFVMSPERREMCLRLKSADDRRRCIAADMLVREIISEKTGLRPEKILFGISENGKPFAKNADIYFNVSHSGHYAAAAFSEKNEVGADVECFRPISPSVTRLFCSEKDMKYIFGDVKPSERKIQDRETLTRFFRVWCFKEAFFKKTGEGIGKHASLIDYDITPRKEILLTDGIIIAVE